MAAVLLFGGVSGFVAFLLTLALGGTRGRIALLIGLGIGLAIAFVLYAYFSAAPSDQQHDCSDCGDVLGRWWEPGLVLLIVVPNFVAWLVGVLVGAGLRPGHRSSPAA